MIYFRTSILPEDTSRIPVNVEILEIYWPIGMDVKYFDPFHNTEEYPTDFSFLEKLSKLKALFIDSCYDGINIALDEGEIHLPETLETLILMNSHNEYEFVFTNLNFIKHLSNLKILYIQNAYFNTKEQIDCIPSSLETLFFNACYSEKVCSYTDDENIYKYIYYLFSLLNEPNLLNIKIIYTNLKEWINAKKYVKLGRENVEIIDKMSLDLWGRNKIFVVIRNNLNLKEGTSCFGYKEFITVKNGRVIYAN